MRVRICTICLSGSEVPQSIWVPICPFACKFHDFVFLYNWFKFHCLQVPYFYYSIKGLLTARLVPCSNFCNRQLWTWIRVSFIGIRFLETTVRSVSVGYFSIAMPGVLRNDHTDFHSGKGQFALLPAAHEGPQFPIF